MNDILNILIAKCLEKNLDITKPRIPNIFQCSPSCLFMLILFLGLKNDNNFGRTGCKESQFYSLIFGQDVASFE